MSVKQEREQAAVLRATCPTCHREAGRGCVSVDRRRSAMRHPHPARVDLIKQAGRHG